ncbi:putative acyl-coA-binding protein [Crassisporium funariophilum]|nr:putative acyl-coA-binding protein [Crassisporium funariophilum]
MPSADFETAAADVKNLKSKPTDNELLKLYGLYKQATNGDNDTAKPGTFDFKGKYKWQAWEDLKGTSQDDAEKKYIALVTELKGTHGF